MLSGAVCEENMRGYAAETGGSLVRDCGTTETGCNWNELSPDGIIASGTVRLAVPCRFLDSSQAQSLGSKMSG